MTPPAADKLPAAPIVRSELPAGLAVSPELVERARDFARASRAEATRTAYASDWAHFSEWCRAHGIEPLPAGAGAVALYAASLADDGFKPATINRRLTSIGQAHKTAGHPNPCASETVRLAAAGIRRTLGTAQKQARPILLPELRQAVAKLPEGLQGGRDRALLLLGFAGAFRRSELVGLNVGDLDFGDDGLTVTIRRSKTDQEGQGRKLGVPFGSDKTTCPVRAVRAWLELASLDKGPVFRPIDRHGNVKGDRLTGHAVRDIVRRIAGADFSGHSLRAGLATAAAKAGKSAHAIMKQTGHKSLAMVSRYVRDAELFTDNAASGIGL